MKRVLVTGGAGFISSNFIRHLLEFTPYEVVTLDALTYAGNLENLADVMSHERLSFVHGDIRDAALGVYGLVYWIVNSNFPGPLFAGAGIVLVLGIQGFVLALIGESLGRVQRDVEGRPLYTIEEEL